MAATPERLYQAHVKNLRAIGVAFERLRLELNECLARGDDKTADALLKTAMLLLGAWAENRLRKVLFEPNGFSSAERELVEASGAQIDCWNKAIELGFRRRFGIPSADLATALDVTPRAHYLSLLDVVERELRPIIEVRNKLAHGQWARTLNNSNDDFSSATMALINGENAHSIKCKRRMLESLALLLHDLVAGNHAFSRDFDKHFRNLEHARCEITTRSYSNWLASMRAKYSRGQAKRRHGQTDVVQQSGLWSRVRSRLF
ncbi:hypothetical protein VWX97_08195 [Phaeobacter sp. JH18-32]